jgi:hypothetical protein
MTMTRGETALIMAAAAVLGLTLSTGAKSSRQRRPKAQPKAAVALNVGDQITVGGVVYTITGTLGLTPGGITPPPPPPPPPPPTPPPPTPPPGPDPQVLGFPDSLRNWAKGFLPGDVVNIAGVDFGTVTGTVTVNTTPQPVLSWGDTQIQIKAPVSMQSAPVLLTVMKPGGGHYWTGVGFSIGARLPGSPPPGDPAPGRRPAKETGKTLPGTPGR